MTLLEGEVIEQIEELDEGWWSGVSVDGSKTGLFPANYVEVVESIEAATAEEPPASPPPPPPPPPPPVSTTFKLLTSSNMVLVLVASPACSRCACPPSRSSRAPRSGRRRRDRRYRSV